MNGLMRPLARRVPVPARRAANAALNAVDPLLLTLRPPADAGLGPVPPRPIRRNMGAPGAATFLRDGRHVADELLAIVDAHGGLPPQGRVLDFGCGAGRVLRYVLPLAPDVEFWGADIDGRSIRWLAGHLPGTYINNRSLPPLEVEDGTFDLVFSVSVLTHLPAARQDLWLREIARVLRPGGRAVLTVHGRGVYETFRAGHRPGLTQMQLEVLRGRGDLDDEGFVFVPDEPSLLASRSPDQANDVYGLSFQSEADVRRRLAPALEVEAILPASINWRQDAVVARTPLESP